MSEILENPAFFFAIVYLTDMSGDIEICQELENWLQNIDLQTSEEAELRESPLDSVPTMMFKPFKLLSAQTFPQILGLPFASSRTLVGHCLYQIPSFLIQYVLGYL